MIIGEHHTPFAPAPSTDGWAPYPHLLKLASVLGHVDGERVDNVPQPQIRRDPYLDVRPDAPVRLPAALSPRRPRQGVPGTTAAAAAAAAGCSKDAASARAAEPAPAPGPTPAAYDADAASADPRRLRLGTDVGHARRDLRGGGHGGGGVPVGMVDGDRRDRYRLAPSEQEEWMPVRGWNGSTKGLSFTYPITYPIPH